jgi:hypothetical protein
MQRSVLLLLLRYPLEAVIFVAFSFESEGGDASMPVFFLSAMMTMTV